MEKPALFSEQVDVTARFALVRRRTLELCQPLTAEDMMVQSCPEASPAKWHLAHTAWFFESFVLREFLPGYRLFNSDFSWLFNSYYESFSQFPEKRLRASFSRPGLDDILRYREHVNEAIERLLSNPHAEPHPEAMRRIELGANHEEQHQELLLTDILHALFTNPLRPTYRERGNEPPQRRRPIAGDPGEGASHPSDEDLSMGTSAREQENGAVEFGGGLREIGYAGDGFCYDNELPRHRVWLEPYALAGRLVTCREYAEFMADGGYRRAELWLSDGWAAVKENGWRAPLYWTEEDGAEENGAWTIFTLRGTKSLEEMADAPVSHLSFYEADAYARWAGCRLPTEFEWEAAAEGTSVEGNLLDSGRLLPVSGSLLQGQGRSPYFGDCWQWTASAYLGYPGFLPLEGALGEYNGKFMSGQMVLRGGSCVTPTSHIRATYRNFFAPSTRWQFSGIRLAR